ncbi:MAG TPA: hypothetical protein VMK65_12680 [Longimicrobiales bacterium]|nr:hypothetical protein [Longimicrobiales bacterium]
MSLIGFHRLLIAAAILFCYGFAVWELYRISVAGGSATLAAVFIVLGTALAFYLYRLRSILKLPE